MKNKVLNRIRVSRNCRNLYHRRRNANQCVDCGELLKDCSFIRCELCRIEKREMWKKTVDSKKCVNCSDDTTGSTNKSYCLSCLKIRSEWWKNRLRNRKKWVVELCGGKCMRCGVVSKSYEIYDFHHKDPEKKEGTIAHFLKYATDSNEFKNELEKCMLVCSNCHRIIHTQERDEGI